MRPAAGDDLPAVAAIYAHYVKTSVATFETDPPDLEFWQRRFDDLGERGLPFLVASDGGPPAGYAFASPWRPRPAYRHTAEDSVYIAPGHGGKGLGTALLRAVLDGCEPAGIRQVIAVIADTGDGASAALHRRLGFTPAGTLRAVGRKHGRWVDTTLMQRTVSIGHSPDR